MGCLTEFRAERIVRERTSERCDIHRSKRAAGFAVFVWGAAALCEPCLREEERATESNIETKEESNGP